MAAAEISTAIAVAGRKPAFIGVANLADTEVNRDENVQPEMVTGYGSSPVQICAKALQSVGFGWAPQSLP